MTAKDRNGLNQSRLHQLHVCEGLQHVGQRTLLRSTVYRTVQGAGLVKAEKPPTLDTA
jgi:hypothetical protein